LDIGNKIEDKTKTINTTEGIYKIKIKDIKDKKENLPGIKYEEQKK
jgi:hypothetical protein